MVSELLACQLIVSRYNGESVWLTIRFKGPSVSLYLDCTVQKCEETQRGAKKSPKQASCAFVAFGHLLTRTKRSVRVESQADAPTLACASYGIHFNEQEQASKAVWLYRTATRSRECNVDRKKKQCDATGHRCQARESISAIAPYVPRAPIVSRRS